MLMKQRPAGFTIIEVLIVLAVSGLMLAFAAAFLKGQTGETTFQQSLSDIQSKIEAELSAVGNSLFPSANNYTCDLKAGTDNVERATLATGGNGAGSNEKCLYLGKAIGFSDDRTSLYIYNVLGGRVYKDSNGKYVEATTFSQTNPEPAIAELTETYKPAAGGIKLLSAHYDGVAAEADLGGFYNDLSGSSAEQNRLLAKGYQLTAGSGDRESNVKNCIEGKAGCTSATMGAWRLCWQDDSKKRTALMEIFASNTGVTTKLTDKACS